MNTMANYAAVFFVLCCVQHDELENSLRDSGLLVQTQKTDHLEVHSILCEKEASLQE